MSTARDRPKTGKEPKTHRNTGSHVSRGAAVVLEKTEPDVITIDDGTTDWKRLASWVTRLRAEGVIE